MLLILSKSLSYTAILRTPPLSIPQHALQGNHALPRSLDCGPAKTAGPALGMTHRGGAFLLQTSCRLSPLITPPHTTCHSDRSGPSLSSAPSCGASGRVVEESWHPFHPNRHPAILTIYGCLPCLYSGKRFRCPLHRHNQFSGTPPRPAQGQALPWIHRCLRRYAPRLF